MIKIGDPGTSAVMHIGQHFGLVWINAVIADLLYWWGICNSFIKRTELTQKYNNEKAP
jgi:hypothetical protein